MKAKSGFILRNIAGEYMLMPTGENIGQFGGTVILNEVSAFIWEKLQTSTTKDKILEQILDEFDVEVNVAGQDLDKAIDQMKKYNLIVE